MLSAMWKQTNLGYLRVDLLVCRLRRLAREGEPSLLDSVLDSTFRENISVNNYCNDYHSISLLNIHKMIYHVGMLYLYKVSLALYN